MPTRLVAWRESRPVFMDFEASGPDGSLVEVGWAEVVAGRAVVEGHLIRPEPGWDEAERDEVAADVRGIALDGLRAVGRKGRTPGRKSRPPAAATAVQNRG